MYAGVTFQNAVSIFVKKGYKEEDADKYTK